MRAVLDTNVLVSGLLWHGAPHTLIDHIKRGTLTLVISPVLLAELDQTLAKPHLQPVLLRSQTSAPRILTDLQHLADLIDPPALPEPVSRDPDDDHVLACALAASADLIITGDQDLLVLHPWRGIAILTPAHALQRIAADAI